MISRVGMTTFLALIFALIGGSAARAQNGVPILVLADGPNGVEKADIAKTTIDGSEWTEAPIVENGLTIHVLFKDPANAGFRDASLGTNRRARLYDALRYVADTLNAPGEVNMVAGLSETDGSGPLAQGGPMFTSSDGLTNGTVFQRLSTGTIPFPGYAEMSLTFDWGYDWYTGTGTPPSDALDMWSVAVHEITHSLGFISLISANGSSRFAPAKTYTIFDTMLATKPSLKHLLGGTAANPSFVGTVADLTGAAVVFAGSAATAAFGSAPPVYSTNPFLQGTSLQHWAEDAIPGGAVMEPRYGYGVTRRQYTDVDIAVLHDIGWKDAEAPEHGPCPLQSVTLLEPSQSTIAADASNTATVHFRANIVLDNSDPLCAPNEGELRVEYYIDNVSRGVSGNQSGHFPLDLTLGTGTHTARASASRTDSVSVTVVTEKTFSITAAVIPPPHLTVTPGNTSTDFGSVNAGAANDTSYTVKNTGNGTLNGSASLSGDTQFQFVGASTYSLSAGATTTVTVRFTPGSKGSYTGTLTFGGNGGTFAVALTGVGAEASGKTGGALNCAGSSGVPGAGAADLLVALLVSLALALARRQMLRR